MTHNNEVEGRASVYGQVGAPDSGRGVYRDSSSPPSRKQTLLDNGQGKMSQLICHSLPAASPFNATLEPKEHDTDRQRFTPAGTTEYHRSMAAGTDTTPTSPSDTRKDDRASQVIHNCWRLAHHACPSTGALAC